MLAIGRYLRYETTEEIYGYANIVACAGRFSNVVNNSYIYDIEHLLTPRYPVLRSMS